MPDKEIRLIVTDMDGTLLSDAKSVGEENIAALKAAEAKGVNIAFCSGRPPNDVSILAIDAGLSPYILGLNGCCCLEKPLGEIWREDLLDESDVRRLVEEIGSVGLISGVFSGAKLILNVPASVYGDPRRVWGSNLLDPRAGFEICYENNKLEEAIARGVNKMMVHDPWRTDDRLARLFKRLPQVVPGPEYTSSWITNIEINPATMNKGKSVKRLADYLGLSMDEVMALGDNDNDISMLEAAGTSVAMGNSTPGALAAATHVTVDYHQSGLAKAVRKLVLHEDVPCVRKLV